MARTQTAKKAVQKPRTNRGEQARARLKRAARDVLERTGYHQMRIVDVTGEAGVAQGLFYHYFSDLQSLTREVLEDFVAESRNLEAIERDVPRGDWYARILAHCRLTVQSYARRPGLMRCLLQLADEDAEFSALLRTSFREQLLWLVEQMPRLFPEVDFKEHQPLLVAYALAGNMEMLLREYFIQRSETLLAANVDADQLSELMAVMFYRGLFLEHPPADQLNYTQNLQHMKRSH